MERKKVLGKIIPAVFVLVLALLLVIIISSCSKAKKTPTGGIVDEKDYLKIDIADNKSYSVSKLEFYNKLRYVGYDVFDDALYEAALIDIVNDIKADIASNGENFDNMKYSKKFKYVIDAQVYGTADEEEISDLEDKDKEVYEKTYLNNLKQKGYEVNSEKGIYQKASLENMTITLAKREFARTKLLEEMEDVDSENQITTKKIEEYFSSKAVDKDDLSALLILLASQTEIEDTLKQLNLKFIGNKLYRVPKTDEVTDYDTYSKYYDETFSPSKDGIDPLEETDVLFEFARVYNYAFAYKDKKIVFEINGKNYLDETLFPTTKPYEASSYNEADYKAIVEFPLADAIAMILAQDTDDDDSLRLNYTKEMLKKIDSTMQSTLSKDYLVASEEKGLYNTPISTYSRGNYLVFKLKDGAKLDYKGIEALANLQNAVGANESGSVLKGHIESIREEFTDMLKGLNLYDAGDDAIKEWALDYAANIKVFGVTGAKEIVASTKDKENENSIFYRIFETMLTSDYINEKLDEFLDDYCSITIYDQLFEKQFAQKHDFYKTGNKQSKTDVLKVTVKDGTGKKAKTVSTTTITASELFDRLNKRYGAMEATYTLGSQILKELYYNDVITETKKKEYEKQYDQIITYFAQGNSSQYGYSPAIGQKAFVNLYFRADNKEDAIFNMWASAELQNALLYSHPDVINSEMYDIFTTLTNISYDNYVNLEYNAIEIYTDDDEDGKPDDWSKVDDADPRKVEIKKLAAELINLFNHRADEEYSNTNRTGAYNDLVNKYKSASRVSQKGNYKEGELPPTFTTDAEKESFYFAQFKNAGIYVTQDISHLVEDGTALDKLDDDAYEAQLKAIYKYMIENHSSELDKDVTFARVLKTDYDLEHIDRVDETSLFECEKGFVTIYLENTTKAPTFKFEYKDNEDTSTGSKVYPYSTDEINPFPLNDEGKPYDNSDKPDTLYNSNDKVAKNQIIVYVREYNDGVESLKLSVVDSFKAYFENQVMTNYTSESFRFYIFRCLINSYKAQNKLTISDELMSQINSFVDAKHESLFGFKTSEISEKWYEYFK